MFLGNKNDDMYLVRVSVPGLTFNFFIELKHDHLRGDVRAVNRTKIDVQGPLIG